MTNNDMLWMKVKWMRKAVAIDLLLSISFSVFGMLLIFGLGFVFPTINPYIVIKWIIIVAGVVFAVTFVKYLAYSVLKMKAMKSEKNEWKAEIKPLKAKKTSKK
jgi:uncharacterized membrane protein (DUF106 family)